MFVSTRAQTLQGMPFGAGDLVPDDLLDAGKASQLVALRRLKFTGPFPPLVAARAFRIGKRAFKRGDPVPAKLLTDSKRAQLLDQRWIEPKP